MNALPTSGTPVTVDYRSNRTGEILTVSGVVTADRYPHMYLAVAGLRIPLGNVTRINGRIMTVKCVGHTHTSQGREHRLLLPDGSHKWVNEHEGLAGNALLKASGCKVVSA